MPVIIEFSRCIDTYSSAKFELNNTYINDYGYEFLKHGDNLYVRYKGLCGDFERIRSEYQIEKAFNPDRFAFNKWLKNNG